MKIYVDATTLIALGTIGELELLMSFDGTLVILPVIRDEVTTEPANTNLDHLCERARSTRRCRSTQPTTSGPKRSVMRTR